MIIGISGRAGAGKDTVGNFLVKNHCFEKIALAHPMKVFCAQLFGWGYDELYGKLKEVPDIHGVIPRYAFQTLGTEWGRELYEDVWAEYAMKEARKRLAYFKADGVCICDVRFKNERSAIQKAGGKVWRIVREDQNRGLVGAAAQHVSETELTDDPEGYDKVLNTSYASLEQTEALVARIIGGRT